MEFEEENFFEGEIVDPLKYKSVFEINREKILEKIIPDTQFGYALDIGCGSGHYTEILIKKGWKTTSIDANVTNIQLVEKIASDVHQGDAVSIIKKFPSGRYDFALMLELVEHMPKLYAKTLLEETHRVLKRGDFLIISTPNKMSLEYLGYLWGEKIRKWGIYPAWDKTHVHIYSSFEIIRFVKKCGFGVKRVTGYWYKGYIPIIHQWQLPILFTSYWPLNRFGFNSIVECYKK